MLRAAIAACAILLAGCEKETWKEGEIIDIADDVATDRVTPVNGRMDELEARMDDLERKLDGQASLTSAVASQADRVAGQVARNAAIANDNVLKDATAAGECGSETYWESPGLLRSRKIPCTAENYFPRR